MPLRAVRRGIRAVGRMHVYLKLLFRPARCVDNRTMRAWRCFAAGLQRCLSSHAGERSVHYWRGGGYLGTGRDPASAADPRFLVTGACGQIGAELIPFLRARVGVENVISSDVKTNRIVRVPPHAS
ncbi:NAD-dependent epimerase/dehydratase, partial [Haematococcus lacustris]